MKIFILAWVALFSTSAIAQNAMCDKLAESIDRGERNVAYYDNIGLLDNSAARDAVRKADATNQLLIMNMNLQIMIQQKCKIQTSPISPLDYAMPALNCATRAESKERDAPECQRDTWKRGFGKK